ncbi:TPA: hypothetical protein ACH3X1_006837 [Trebouxia sp. C0004]
MAASTWQEFSAVASVQLTGSMAGAKREVAVSNAIQQVLQLLTPNNQGEISSQTAAPIARLLEHEDVTFKQGVQVSISFRHTSAAVILQEMGSLLIGKSGKDAFQLQLAFQHSNTQQAMRFSIMTKITGGKDWPVDSNLLSLVLALAKKAEESAARFNVAFGINGAFKFTVLGHNFKEAPLTLESVRNLFCSASGTSLAALEDSTLSKLSSSNEGLHLYLRLGDAATMAMTLLGVSNMDMSGVLTVESERFRILPNNILVPIWLNPMQPDSQSVISTVAVDRAAADPAPEAQVRAELYDRVNKAKHGKTARHSMVVKAARKLLTSAQATVTLQEEEESLSAQLAQYGNLSALLADNPPLAPHPIQALTRGLPPRQNQPNRGKRQREGEPGEDKQVPKGAAAAPMELDSSLQSQKDKQAPTGYNVHNNDAAME